MYYFNQSETYRLEELWSLFYTGFCYYGCVCLVRNVCRETEQTDHIVAVAGCVPAFRTNTVL